MSATITLGADAVDLERYPIADLDAPAGRDLVRRCREQLRARGACELEGFMRPEAVAGAVRGVAPLEAAAFRTETTHNLEFSGREAELDPDDPLRIQVRSAKGLVAYDQVPADSPLRAVYESDVLTRFVGAALEVEPIYRQADEIGALNVMFYGAGDELGWHVDNADFVVTLMLRASAAGGAFEYVPLLLRTRTTPTREAWPSPAHRRPRGRADPQPRAGHARPVPRAAQPAPRHAGRRRRAAHQRGALLRRRARRPAERERPPDLLRPGVAPMTDETARAMIRAHFDASASAPPAARPMTIVRASEIYADDAVVEWPQGGERVRGRANIIAFRSTYPARQRSSSTGSPAAATSGSTSTRSTTTTDR